jgi:hypothetical protein
MGVNIFNKKQKLKGMANANRSWRNGKALQAMPLDQGCSIQQPKFIDYLIFTY